MCLPRRALHERSGTVPARSAVFSAVCDSEQHKSNMVSQDKKQTQATLSLVGQVMNEEASTVGPCLNPHQNFKSATPLTSLHTLQLSPLDYFTVVLNPNTSRNRELVDAEHPLSAVDTIGCNRSGSSQNPKTSSCGQQSERNYLCRCQLFVSNYL